MPELPSREQVVATLKLAGAYAAPNGYYVARDRLRARRLRHEDWAAAQAAIADRHAEAFSYEEAVRFLVRRGLDERQVRDGSMPEASLAFARARALERLPTGRPLTALHVGNFVGVSLAYVTSMLRSVHPESVTVSVDPGITHRGIADPGSHVLALLGHFGLLAGSLVVRGYSLEQNLGDHPTADAVTHVRAEQACERVLDSLGTLAPGGFDLVLLDGNHSAEYLGREMTAVGRLLRSGAVVVVDDVAAGVWDGVVEVFDAAVAAGDRFEELGRDGRAGVLRFTSADESAGIR